MLWLPSRTSKSFLNVTAKISFRELAKRSWDARTPPCMPGFLLSGSHPLLFWVPCESSLLLDMRGLGLTSRSFALSSEQMVFPPDVSRQTGLRCSELASGCSLGVSSTGPRCLLPFSLWSSWTDAIKAALGFHEGLSPTQEGGHKGRLPRACGRTGVSLVVPGEIVVTHSNCMWVVQVGCAVLK